MSTANNVECKDDSIQLKGVSKRFGKVQALNEINLTVKQGVVFALLGPNGCGKTTMVRVLTTLLRPESGSALVGGFDVVHNPQNVRNIIGLAGQYPAVDENLTGAENLEMIGRLYHLDRKTIKKRVAELLEGFSLTEASNRRTKTYSGGMRRRLDLAATIVASPSILFLDEPTTGLDPRSRLALWEVIAAQTKNCNTVFLTTQYLEEADRLAKYIAIMDKGKILRVGTPQELKECCGGEVRISLRLTDRNQINQAADLLRTFAKNELTLIPETGEISMPANGETSLVSEIVRRFDTAGFILAELGLKQPTLDDVFLSITGHSTEENEKTDSNSNTKSRGAV